MKNVFKVSLLAAAVALTVGCNEQQKSEATQAVTADAPVAQQAATFASEQEKVEYAIGQSFSQQFNAILAKQEELGMALNKEVVLQGITDTLRDTAKLSDDEVMETLQAYGEKVKTTVEAKMKAEAEKSAAEAKTFLDENAKQEGVTVTESGLQYSVITKVEGPKPTADDTVTVHYVGTFIDGKEFDSSVKRGQPATFPLNRVIPGWTEGVQLMSVGEKYKFVIPADIAYGPQGSEAIPPNSTLVFEVELLEIKSAEAPAEEAPVAEAPAAE